MKVRSLFTPFFKFKLFISARLKLVGAFIGVLALVLILFSGALLELVHYNLYTNLNNQLATEGNRLTDLIELKEGELLYAELDNLNLDDEKGLRTLAIQMYDSQGNLVWRASRNQLPASPTIAETADQGQTKLSNLRLPYERYRVLTLPVKNQASTVGVLQVGLSLRGADLAFNRLLIGILISIPGALIMAAILAWFLSNKVLKPIEDNIAKQRQFIQDASHELRTPLAIMQSNIDVTLQNPKPTIAQLKEKLRTMGQTTKRMNNIISDLFELSTSDTHSMRFDNKLIDLGRTICEVAKQMRSLASKKSHKLSLKNYESLTVYADDERIKQVLTILIDNAIKYTPPETEISLSLKKTPRVDYAKLSVSDNGPGISKADQARIFERFYRADKSRSREIGGTGLGLSIAKTIVRKQRGYLAVRSKLGEGTRFDIFLPLVAEKKPLSFRLPNIFGGLTDRDARLTARETKRTSSKQD